MNLMLSIALIIIFASKLIFPIECSRLILVVIAPLCLEWTGNNS